MDLHIISLNIPYPPDYGGMIDTYYRIKSLHDLGVQIHLHCFEYGRLHSSELESLCATTSYYPRKTGLLKHFSATPYIVASRKSKKLLENLIINDYPILFDGLHSTFYINHPALSGRKKFVRLHNIEHKYYRTLSYNEPNLLKKSYFLLESAKLKRYERILWKADYTLPISDNDQIYFNNKYQNSEFLAPFHAFYEFKCLTGTGNYIIYHGDLSVNENSVVASSLISDVFSKLPFKCIIAGKDPPGFVKSYASRYPNISVVTNPDYDQMTSLIVNAQINILPAFATNGFKLKLLFALYTGRHCLVNALTVGNSSVKNLCHVADSNVEMIKKVYLLMKVPFTEEMLIERRSVLTGIFDVRINAKKLIKLVFEA